MFFLIRRPSTPEDEGHFGFIDGYKTLAAAEAARTEIVQKSKGYFRDSSFVIAQEIPAEASPPLRSGNSQRRGKRK